MTTMEAQLDWLSKIGEELKALKELRQGIQPIAQAIRKIESDIEYRRDGNDLIAVIDFSELYRYLHPFLDYSAYFDPTRFYAEQAALQYLFSRKVFVLTLLSEYEREYKATLHGMADQFSEFAITLPQNVRQRIAFLDKSASRMMRLASGATGDSAEGLSERATSIDPVLIDFVFNNVRVDMLRDGVRHFRKMLEAGTICHAAALDGIESNDLGDCDQTRYLELKGR